MTMQDFNHDWTVRSADRAETPVTLPHDAMIHERRDPKCGNGVQTGFFPGGVYTYRKSFEALSQWRGQRVALLFEGAYHRSVVTLNGQVVGGRPSGYAEFFVDLDEHLRLGEVNELEVVVDTAGEPNSRWYSGSGLYRPVRLEVTGPVRIARDGVRFGTVSVGDTAEVTVDVVIDRVEGARNRRVKVAAELSVDGTTAAASSSDASTADTVQLTLAVPYPRLWSAETPHLYELVVRLWDGEEVLDEYRHRVGLRTVSVDAERGLRINGESTKLRGGCVHHDHGVLGAATFRAAEFRRAWILKQAGFNAVRAGHSPIGRDFLDACDEVGLYLMDELTDVWFVPKTKYDYAKDFHAWWRADLASMVAKSRNHPSVVMHSLGNENGETCTPEGIAVGREMARYCRELDPTRPVTAGVNPMVNGLARFGIGVFKVDDDETEAKKKAQKPKPAKDGEGDMGAVGSAFFNQLIARVGSVMNSVGRLKVVDRATSGICDVLDVAGYNYGSGAYRVSRKRHPHRVLLGSETLPPDIVRNWQLVEELPYLIGDFIWTAWDYLGEVGLGAWGYGAQAKTFPGVIAGGGAIDINGQPGAMAFHAQAAWGVQDQPAIVVRPLDHAGVKPLKSPWRTTDAIASWSWSGHENEPAAVIVYSAAAQVELLLNGRSLGTRPTGRKHNCQAEFTVPYAAGELTAVARTATGIEHGRSTLVSAGKQVQLRLRADRTDLTANGQDLAFVDVELADDAGTVAPLSGVPIRASVDGDGSLAGFGSADPRPGELAYTDGRHHTYYGRALAVVRSGTKPGEVRLTVTADGHGEQTITLNATAGKDE